MTTEVSKFSKEPRPVYYKELDVLGFDQYWNYPKDEHAPLLWAEANNYIYKGRTVAKTKGGSLYTAPELILLEDPEPDGKPLKFVDVDRMVEKNSDILETLAQETIQKVYNTYLAYKDKVDVFYVAFSGGKDSVVALDIVQRALPHDAFKVMFGDTRMEFPDTYKVVEEIKHFCEQNSIQFYTARSKLLPSQTWDCFGPPATSIRWCCSVHKTSPQINLLREITGKHDFTGMAFTGVRAEESVARSTYDSISEGQKHTGQMSCHTILEWSSAELFNYIYLQKLTLNEAYLKGNARAGCLVCPNSSGRNEYVKRCSYTKNVDAFVEKIAKTSGKVNYSPKEMQDFIDAGFWRTRKTGRELNFGQDRFEILNTAKMPSIDVYKSNLKWQQWAKTIGNIDKTGENTYTILFAGKYYIVQVLDDGSKTTFTLLNCSKTKADIRFESLIRSVIVKSLYCVGCGVCEAECKFGCISMRNGISIGDNCQHCYKCHDIHEHCLRYNSIRNKITGGKKMAGLDRYFSFGVRQEWMESFVGYEGGADFWTSDGDGLVANKKKDAFKNFADDAGLIVYNKQAAGDKYTKCLPTAVTNAVVRLGADSQAAWALMLCNLVYTPAYNWFVNNLEKDVDYSPDAIKLMLSSVMESDTKGLGKRNVVDALKVVMAKTPLGMERIFADCLITEKVSANGNETLTLVSFKKCAWENPDPLVILYSLYKFAEACGDYYQFRLSTLLDDDIERDGVSPTRIFGLSRETMIPLLNGLTANYPDFISASFTLDLENITLRPDKSAQDVLELF